VTSLCDKFEPNTGAAKAQAKQEFYQLKLGNADDDPDPWIISLELKRRRLKTLGTTIEDDDMILHILNNLPKAYETVVELCEEDLSKGIVNLQAVKERIRARYTRIQKANENMGEVIALMGKSQFKGACSVCGKIGHKGADCFSLERNKARSTKNATNATTTKADPKTKGSIMERNQAKTQIRIPITQWP
jgi:uncharacterized protein (DUF885 family)